ncbi:TRAP transporter small permease subunit [Arenibacterium sp. LLYu02]|uniref:TRAP transporter small permease subunit n=1 Tax=Arenibacterium sp. LLYu02 TaxID=3404132 RepID=UPI003B20BDD5
MTETYDPAPEAGRLGRAITQGSLVFAVAALASVAILGTEVVLRYLFNRPTLWAHETVIFLNACIFVYGGLFATARDSHIRVVLLYGLLSVRWRRRLDLLIYGICGLSCLVFAWATKQMVARALFAPDGTLRVERSGSAWNPPTPGLLKLFLLVVLLAMAVQFARLALGAARPEAEGA